jgi:hypothetical protein
VGEIAVIHGRRMYFYAEAAGRDCPTAIEMSRARLDAFGEPSSNLPAFPFHLSLFIARRHVRGCAAAWSHTWEEVAKLRRIPGGSRAIRRTCGTVDRDGAPA